eukprot:7681849-Pyramimonas_sp.AAC.1
MPDGKMGHEANNNRLVYSLSPTAIGARYGYILSPLLQLVPATGIFSLPYCNWCPLRVYSLSPSAIGARHRYIRSPLPRLVPHLETATCRWVRQLRQALERWWLLKATARYPLGLSRTMWILLFGFGMATASAGIHVLPPSSLTLWKVHLPTPHIIPQHPYPYHHLHHHHPYHPTSSLSSHIILIIIVVIIVIIIIIMRIHALRLRTHPSTRSTVYQGLPSTRVYRLPGSTVCQGLPSARVYRLPGSTVYQGLPSTR